MPLAGQAVTRPPRRGLTAAIFDRFVYAPIGLAFEAGRLLPDLADRGRRQVELSRSVGEKTVDTALRRVGLGLQGGVEGLARRRQPEPRPSPRLRVVPSSADGPPASELAIPDYDSLAASQVVPRLPGLTPSERAAVHDYELATRARRTILTAIARLEA